VHNITGSAPGRITARPGTIHGWRYAPRGPGAERSSSPSWPGTLLLFPGSQSITRVLVEEALTKAGLALSGGPGGRRVGSDQDLRRRRFRRGGGAGAVFIERMTAAGSPCETREPCSARTATGLSLGGERPCPPAARELIRLVDPGYPELAPGGGRLSWPIGKLRRLIRAGEQLRSQPYFFEGILAAAKVVGCRRRDYGWGRREVGSCKQEQ
jgi:hypothetical protein